MTGWPPGLLQDDCRELSRWFASRVDARWVFRRHLTSSKNYVIIHTSQQRS